MNLVSKLFPFDVKLPETSLSELCGIFSVLLDTYDDTLFLLPTTAKSMPSKEPKSRTPSSAISRSSSGIKKNAFGSHGKFPSARNTILSLLDPERVSATTAVDSLSVGSLASNSSSIPLPFPPMEPISHVGYQKNDDNQKKDEVPKESDGLQKNTTSSKKNDDSIFATPAPRTPIDAQKKVREKNEINGGDSLNQSSASDTASSRPTDMLSLHDSLVHDGPGVSPVEAGLEDSTSNASARDLDDPRHAFTSPSPNHTPPKPSNMNSDKGPNEALSDVVMSPNPESTVPQAKHLEHNPIKALAQRSFRPQGALPTGFPEPRDLTKDVQGGKIPVKGQNRFSKIDILSSTPTVYHDTSPLPPPDLLAALVPTPQILLFGDGLPYRGFLRSFSIADMANFEWQKLIGLVSFAILPTFSPFQDEPPFFSHRTIVKQIVSMLRAAKKQDKPTTFWLAYQARTNVADVELAAVLDRRIDLVPSLSFLWLSVVCQVVHMGVRSPDTYNVSTAPSPLDQPLVILQLTSFPLPKNHIPQTIGYFPRNVDSAEPVPSHVHTPQSTLFQIRVDVPIDITREVDGVEVKWHISGSLPLMLMLNGLNPDDTSTVLKELTIPRITKTFWPVIVNSAPEGYKIFDFFVPFDVLGNFYDEQPALMDMGVSIGLLDKSVKESSLVITNQPRFQKGGPRRRKLPADEVRTAIEMNPALYRKFAFLVLLNRYDVLGMVHDPMLIQPAVQEIENLGEMICVSAHTNNRVFAKDFSREVNPPYSIVRFPPTIDIRDVVKSAATFGPVDGHQIFQQSGLVMIKYQAHQSALTSYGATLPGPVYFTSGSSEKDVQMSITDRLEQVRLASLPSPRLNEANLAAVSDPFGALSIPDIHSTTLPSPHPSVPPSESTTSSFLPQP